MTNGQHSILAGQDSVITCHMDFSCAGKGKQLLKWDSALAVRRRLIVNHDIVMLIQDLLHISELRS